MSIEGQKIYPGEDATALQVLGLADEYKRAAETLLPMGRRRKPLSRAPYRLLAIQAIELYLNALLLSRGLTSAKIRGLQHDMAARARFARDNGLVLRRATVLHLNELSRSREYLISRYGPDMNSSLSQLNRLWATLKEVSEKVAKIMGEKAATK